MRRRNLKTNHLLAVAYGVLVVLIVIAFVNVERTKDRVELESQRRAFVLCQVTNDDRETLLAIVEGALTPPSDEHLESLSPEVQEYFESIQPRREAFLEEVESRLSPISCPPDPDDARD